MTATPQTIIRIFNVGIDFLNKHNWCQGTFALDKHGKKVSIHDRHAVQFCCASSIEKGLFEAGFHHREVAQAMTIASDAFIEEFGYDFCVFNDKAGRTKEEVIEAFTKIKKKYEKIAYKK